jgi:hypothetical protein
VTEIEYCNVSINNIWIKVTYNRPPRAQRLSRDIALLILDLGARRGW